MKKAKVYNVQFTNRYGNRTTRYIRATNQKEAVEELKAKDEIKDEKKADIEIKVHRKTHI